MESNLDIWDFYNVPVVFDKPDDSVTSAKERELKYFIQSLAPHTTVIEFGVYKGDSINLMAKYRSDLNFIGFDSFEGLPIDWNLGKKFIKKSKFSLGGKLPQTKPNVKLVPGFFDESIDLEKINLSKQNISAINLDADLYESTITVLSKLNDLIKSDMLIRFDELAEWRIPPFSNQLIRGPKSTYTLWEQGEWRALNEWCTQYNRQVKPLARNFFQSSIVKIIR